MISVFARPPLRGSTDADPHGSSHDSRSVQASTLTRVAVCLALFASRLSPTRCLVMQPSGHTVGAEDPCRHVVGDSRDKKVLPCSRHASDARKRERRALSRGVATCAMAPGLAGLCLLTAARTPSAPTPFAFRSVTLKSGSLDAYPINVYLFFYTAGEARKGGESRGGGAGGRRR